MWRWLVAAVFSTATALHASEPPAVTTPTASEIASLEHARDKAPGNVERRNALAGAYYRFARAAFDRGEQAVYTDYLERATKEWVEALRLMPENPEPHTSMGIVAAYQGRIDDALDSFYNARALAPGNPAGYSNIAETLIYAGHDASEVETWLSRAERMGMLPAVIELNYCLLKWRDGDATSAARHFRNALHLDPDVVHVWNEAPVSKPILSFVDLTNYCCGSPACGPYLARACQKSELAIAQRKVPEETALRELRIEMERRREIERIYKKRQDLEIRVQKPDDEKPANPSTPSATDTPKETPP